MHPTKITCVRTLEIDAGHRVYGHEGKCAHLHGHRYKFEIHAKPKETLDNIGRVVDFGVVKAKVGAWLDLYWDHGMILYEKDPILKLWQGNPPLRKGTDGPLVDHKYYSLPFNPTAENLAHYLLSVAQTLLSDNNIVVDKVVCWETPNCFAVAKRR